MNTSEWAFAEHQGSGLAIPGSTYGVPVSVDLGTSAQVVDIWCDHAGIFHVPTHLAAEVVEWLQRQELLQPAPDLQGRGSAPKDEE